MHHDLKIEKKYFDPVLKNIKTFEIRKNDRHFNIGDTFSLNEIDEKRDYTGRSVSGKITYITDYAQKEDYVVFGFVLMK